MRRVELETAINRPGVRIDQQFVWIEAVTTGRIIGSVHAIAITLTCADPRNPAVPDVTVAPQRFAEDFPISGIEKTEFHFLSVGGEQFEFHTAAIACRAERNFVSSLGHRSSR